MVFRTRAGDRRSARFEVLGSLSGTLRGHEMLTVCNLSCGGVLVESLRPLIANSEHTIELNSAGSPLLVRARVVRATPSTHETYTIAFEFMDAMRQCSSSSTRLSPARRPVSDRGAAPRDAERRRFPRRTVRAEARLHLLIDVELIDVSLTGALVKCQHALRLGDRAQLQTVLDREPFVAAVSVSRVAVRGPDGSDLRIGVRFSSESDNSAAILRHFLERASRAPMDGSIGLPGA